MTILESLLTPFEASVIWKVSYVSAENLFEPKILTVCVTDLD